MALVAIHEMQRGRARCGPNGQSLIKEMGEFIAKNADFFPLLRTGVSVQAWRSSVCQKIAFDRLGVTSHRSSRLAQVGCGILIGHCGSDSIPQKTRMWPTRQAQLQVLTARATRFHSDALRLLQMSPHIPIRNKASCLRCPGPHESSSYRQEMECPHFIQLWSYFPF